MKIKTPLEILKYNSVDIIHHTSDVQYAMQDYSDQQNDYIQEQLQTAEILFEAERNAKSKWIPITEKLPDLNENIESDYVVCFSEFSGQFIGWYNGQTKIWVAAIYTSNNNEISHVTHWKLKDVDPE